MPKLNKYLFLVFLLLMTAALACSLTGGSDDEEPATTATPVSGAAVSDEKPTVVVNSPADGSEVVVNTEVLIYSSSRHPEGVTRVELLENGIILDTVQSPNPDGQTEFSVLQRWQPDTIGTASLQVIAYHNEVASDPAEVSISVKAQQEQVNTPVVIPDFVQPVPTADTTCRARINIDNLAVGSQPGFGAQTFATIRIGEVYALTGRTGDNSYWEISVNGQDGWVRSVYTILLGNCSNLPVTGEVASAPTPTNTAVPSATPSNTPAPTIDPNICRVQVISASAPVRNQPNINAGIIVSLAGNSEWRIFQRTQDSAWWQIDLQGVLGWIAASDVAVRGDCSGTGVATQEVAAVNQNPSVDPIAGQSVEVGDVVDVPIVARDPENASVVVAVRSSDPSIAIVSTAGQGIEVRGVAEGTVTITVTVTDPAGNEGSAQFRVNVTRQPVNQPPVITPILDRSILIGETITVELQANDPEGTTVFIASVQSGSNQIATAQSDNRGNISVRGVSAGTANIEIRAEDGDGGTATTRFAVTVVEPTTVPNQPPTISTVEPQTILVGDSVTVSIEASDPEGFRPFITAVRSGSDQIARARADNAGNVNVEGISAGQVNIQVTVDDGSGGTATTTFTVIVVEPTKEANNPPQVEPIPDQELLVGDRIDVPVNASDPEGFRPFLASVESAASTIATAQSNGSGGIQIRGVSSGSTTVTVVVDDGTGETTALAFNVRVDQPTEVPNLPPDVEAIPDQEIEAGERITVPVSASDPEGFRPFIADVESGSDQIAAARSDNAGGIEVVGVSAGEVEITVTIDDGTGETTTINFNVTVTQPEEPTDEPNQPPTIEPIADQQVMVGESISVAVVASDPEGFQPFILSVESGSSEIARARSNNSGGIEIGGVSTGNAQITVTVDDGNGETASTSFNVEVIEPTVAPNLPPEVEPVEDQTILEGDEISIPITASDPEGFNTFIAFVNSESTAIADIESGDSNNVIVTGISAGTTQLTVRVDDGTGETTAITFNVTVLAPTDVPNDPPVLQDIQPQTLEVGEQIAVQVIASDPEGFNVFLDEVSSASTEIATAQSDGGGNIVLTGISPGSVDVSLTVSDGTLTTSGTFNVTVTEPPSPIPNEPPQIESIGEQTVNIGEVITVEVNSSDPEGTNVFIADVTSAANEIAQAQADGQGNVAVGGVSPGQVTITITVEDGDGNQAETSFNVIVPEPPTEEPNLPPVVEAVSDQTVEIGEEISVPIFASDPEGFNTFIAGTRVSDETIVSINTGDSSNVILRGLSAGTAVVTVGVTDGNEGVTRIEFNVTVPEQPTEIPNQAPIVEPVIDQFVEVGQSATVFVTASDPEGFNVFISEIESAADTIATAEPDGSGNILITGVSPGTTQIGFIVDDGNGGQTPITFNVTVPEPPTEQAQNEPPTIQAIENREIPQDQFTPIEVIASDPEGAQVVLSVQSGDENIAAAQIQDGQVVVYGVSPGDVAITVTADDTQGGIASAVFGVRVVPSEVAQAPTDSDNPLVGLPILPTLEDQVLQNIQSIHNQSSMNPNVFVVIGDVTPADLLVDAGDGNFDLSGAQDVQQTFNTYFSQPLEDGNVLNRGGVRSSDADWLISDLLDAANNTDDCATLPHPIGCALMFDQPAVAFLMVGRNDLAAGTPAEDFARTLNDIALGLAQQGVIPVLVTIPGEGENIQQYNLGIALVADRNGFPLWNLWNAIPYEQVNSDLTLTSPGAGQNGFLTTDNINNYGAVQRNYQLLQVLDRLRQAIPLN